MAQHWFVEIPRKTIYILVHLVGNYTVVKCKFNNILLRNNKTFWRAQLN